jgi:hypothetical protein
MALVDNALLSIACGMRQAIGDLPEPGVHLDGPFFSNRIFFRVVTTDEISDSDVAAIVIDAFPEYALPRVVIYTLCINGSSASTDNTLVYNVNGGNFDIETRLRLISNSDLSPPIDAVITKNYGYNASQIIQGVLTLDVPVSVYQFGNHLFQKLNTCPVSTHLLHVTHLSAVDGTQLDALNLRFDNMPCRVFLVSDVSQTEQAYDAIVDLCKLKTCNEFVREWTAYGYKNVTLHPFPCTKNHKGNIYSIIR